MQNKKGFTLIELMIVVAIIAILAMIAVPMYQKYIERSRNASSQNLLQQLALAQIGRNTDDHRDAADTFDDYILTTDGITGLDALARYGFRVDPNVGFEILDPVGVANPNGGTYTLGDGFIAYAAHKAIGSNVFVYDNLWNGGVVMWSSTATYPVASTGSLNMYVVDASGNVQLGTSPITLVTTSGKVTSTT